MTETFQVVPVSTRAKNRLGPASRIFPSYHPLFRWAESLPDGEVEITPLEEEESPSLDSPEGRGAHA